MGKLTLLLILIPVLSFSQIRKTDHLVIARNSAYTSVGVMAAGALITAGMIQADDEAIEAAGATAAAFVLVGMVFYIRAWHHVGESGRQTSFYIKPEGATLAISF